MAVFTSVSSDQAQAFAAGYGLGDLTALEPIAEGVENTNYRLEAVGGRYVLTLFERRTDAAGLPFCLGLTEHLAERGLPTARPLRNRAGQWVGTLNDRPAAIVHWLNGAWLRHPEPAELEAVGALLARMHLAARDFNGHREDPVAPPQQRVLAQRCGLRAAGQDRIMLNALTAELDRLAAFSSRDLPGGPIHADFFPDNVLFQDGAPSGVIDFYFAHVGAWAYDLATALNAWAFDAQGQPRPRDLVALMRGYERVRPLSSAEVETLPALGAASAVRFTLTRLHDRLFHDPNWVVTPKDPAPFLARVGFHRAARSVDYGLHPA